MRRLVRGLLKWAILSALAVVLGAALGTAYATTFKEPVLEAEPLETGLQPPVEDAGPARDTTAPPAPVLVTPADGALVSLRPTLAWEPVADASPVIYGLDVSTDPGFPAEATLRVRNLQEPQWRPDVPFTPLVKMHWRVYALDAGLNEGPMSEARTFTPVFPLGDVAVEGVPPTS